MQLKFENRSELLQESDFQVISKYLSSDSLREVFQSDWLNSVEVITYDSEYYYVFSTYERESSTGTAIDQVDVSGLPSGYRVYKFQQNKDDLVKGSTAWLYSNDLEVSAPNEALQVMPDGSSRKSIPNIVVQPNSIYTYPGYSYQDMILEELLHVEDMQIQPWINGDYSSCLSEGSLESLIDKFLEFHKLDNVNRDILKVLGSRYVIGELYPALIIGLLRKDYGFVRTGGSGELLKAIKEGKDHVSASGNVRELVDLLSLSLEKEILEGGSVDSIRSLYRTWYGV